ncbi:MAG: glycosyltransferase family 2 protein [Spirochaetia bacterium]|nr:glycosyltransferase family 2 protein [Spirochaetia bacterium]
MNVSIIIVNYNTRELTKNCLNSIYEQTKGINFEVIVSDNGSTDGSIEMIKSDFPQVILIENNENLGFGKANNIGAKIAKGTYLFFLNSDTVFINNAVKYFFDYAENDNQNLLLGAYLRYPDETVSTSYGTFINPFVWTLKKNIYDFYPKILEKRLSQIKEKRTVAGLNEKFIDYITAADLFVKNDVFNEIGGFDENFFMYHEDEDLGRTALKNGFKSKIISEPKIIHLESKSSKIKIKKLMVQDTSFFYYCKKWNSPFKFLLIKTFFYLVFPIRFFSKELTKLEKQEMKENIKTALKKLKEGN